MNRKCNFTTIIEILFVCLTLSLVAHAQAAGGSISGTITDSAGAAVPNAEIKLLNPSTGISRTLASNESGFFEVPNLLPGLYELTATASGFASVLEKVQIKVGAESVINIQLKTGNIEEQVTVEAGTPVIDQASSTLLASVEGRNIRELPLNGRDWTQLATLEPGVSTINTQNPTVLGNAGRANRGLGSQLSVGGARPQQNNYRLDGISINDYSGGGPGNTLGAVLGVEAIQEFSVVTANPSGEYGKTSGGVFNAVTRSGANTFHGSAFEFHRNSALDARNFFDKATVPPFKRHQFGGSIGGPIRKDKTFFFFDYEGLRENLSTTNPITVPSAAARTGALTGGTVTVDPKVVPYLSFYPLPDSITPGDTGIATLVQNTTTKEGFYTARIDQTFSAADSMHGTFFIDNSSTEGPDSFNITTLGNTSRRKMISLEETHIISPTLINTARVVYSRVTAKAPVTLGILNHEAENPALGFLPGGLVGSITVSGLTLFPGLRAQESSFVYNSYQVYDDLFYSRGLHSLKFGFSAERLLSSQISSSAINGSWQFGSVRNFLTNQGQNFQAQQPDLITNPTYLQQTIAAGYVQDDWRARPNLTLNLGLRYEMATVPDEKYNRLATLANLTDAQPKLGSPYFQNPTRTNFSPRLGFAWDPFKDGKTSVRGAFGIYDTLPLTYQFLGLNLANAPFVRVGVNTNTTQLRNRFPNNAANLLSPETSRVSYIEQDPSRSYVLQWNLNVQREVIRDLTVQLGYVGSHGVHQPFRSQDADLVLPTMTAAGLLWPIRSATGAAIGTKLNVNVGQINALVWQESTSYNALNVKVTRRLRQGFLAGIAYTWSKSLDTGSSSVIGTQFANSLGGMPLQFQNLFRGRSDFDVAHAMTVNYLWELPAPHSESSVIKALTNGWQWGGIVKAQTGLPFSVTIGGDSLGMLSQNGFNLPDWLDTPACKNPINPGNPDHYIKVECFVAPNPGSARVPPTEAPRLGNAGRNRFTGPGLFNVDMSLNKNNYIRSISENFNLQLRFDLFNVMNHPNFRPPTGAAAQVFNASYIANSAATVGRLTSTATTSRQIQVAVKVLW